jgi:hypothetical protein
MTYLPLRGGPPTRMCREPRPQHPPVGRERVRGRAGPEHET